MRRTLVLAWLAACPSPDDTDTDWAVDTDTDTDTDTLASGRAAWRNPAQAEDLDPAIDVVSVRLVAAPATFEVGGETVEGYAYNGQVPGPTIRARVGDTLRVELVNQLDTGTTIHWHGVHVPWAMDGVTWMGAPIGAGDSFVYTYALRDAGTFWYHPHFDTARQVDLGLYGVLIVEDPAEPTVDRELVAVLDSWDEHRHSQPDDLTTHGLEDPELRWTVNGVVDPLAEIGDGEVVRLRVVDVSNAGVADLSGLGRRIAGDQGLLAAPDDSGEIVLAPGDRAEFELRPAGDLDVTLHPYSVSGGRMTWADPSRLFTVRGAGGAGVARDWPFSGAAPSPDPGWADIVYTFQGDPHTGQWRINGEAYPDVTIESLARDSEAVIEVRNLSATEHPFHLHGHAFEVLSLDGVPPTVRTLEDTIEVPIRGVVRLRLVADNPGDWMAHCHILSHAEGGMMTVLRVGED